eukprot:CAMPEP_0198691050 /NCGR_PEP_ID=MMETSP1468-20131203/194186_1 /TAXON_ID=1461545 /ORGANISM="Mantoniella sp, Strain CCMP1436" /LENGTH=39 /DNA_ID= /DNA_START= /DNA_END= /DNA_ORIENTATION=
MTRDATGPGAPPSGGRTAEILRTGERAVSWALAPAPPLP